MVTLIIATFLSFIIKGMCGFGNEIVFDSITGFAQSNVSTSPVELVVGYPSNFVIAWRERKFISVKKYIPLIVFLILGSVPGAILLKGGEIRMVKLILGIAIIVIGVELLLREHFAKKRKASGVCLLLIGILSGLLCGMFGVDALLASYVSRVTESSSEFRGNLCFLFLVENTVRMILYAITGILTLSLLKNSLVLLPVMLIGLVVGIWLSKVAEEKRARQVVLLLLICSGASLILRNV